jgi:hypothetical protein
MQANLCYREIASRGKEENATRYNRAGASGFIEAIE